jgi:excisionase family DNA binding protein
MHELIPEPASCAALPLTVRVRETCRLTGIGRSKIYELIAAGRIAVIKVGTITLIPTRSLEGLFGLGSSSPGGFKNPGTSRPWRRQIADLAAVVASRSRVFSCSKIGFRQVDDMVKHVGT